MKGLKKILKEFHATVCMKNWEDYKCDSFLVMQVHLGKARQLWQQGKGEQLHWWAVTWNKNQLKRKTESYFCLYY